MRHVVESSSYAVLLEAAAQFLATLKSYPEILILAHSRGAADEFARACCQTGLLGAHRTTITGLAVDLAEMPLARAGLSPLSSLGTEAMVARIIHKLKPRSIPYFQPVADTPGLARAVAASLSELRVEGVRPEQVAATGPPGQDLAQMAAAFERELADASVADFATLLQHATAVARDGKHRLLGLPVLLLDVDLASARRRELIEAVLARAPVVFAACLGADRKNIAALEHMLGVFCEAKPIGTARTLDRIRASLFAETVPPEAAADASLDYFSAAGEALECVEIARRIRGLAAEGIPFDRIAILLRSPERYQPLVEEALRRAGIPAYFSRGVARPDPAGRAFLALLACAGEGCSATRFAEYLSLGQAPPLDRRAGADNWLLPPPEDEVLQRFYGGVESADILDAQPQQAESEDSAVINGTLQSPAVWEKLLVDAAVIGGRERWARRLRGLTEEFRVRLSELGREGWGRRRPLAAGNCPSAEPGALRSAAGRYARLVAEASRLGRMDRQSAGFGHRCAGSPRIRALGAQRIAGNGRGRAGGARRSCRGARRPPSLPAPRAAPAPLWRGVCGRHRGGPRPRIRCRISAGALRRIISQPLARRSDSTGYLPA